MVNKGASSGENGHAANHSSEKERKTVAFTGKKLDRLAEKVERGIEKGEEYLKSGTIKDLSSQVTSAIKRYPIQAFFLGISAGLMLGSRWFSRRS